jgi:hypothetical protein
LLLFLKVTDVDSYHAFLIDKLRLSAFIISALKLAVDIHNKKLLNKTLHGKHYKHFNTSAKNIV